MRDTYGIHIRGKSKVDIKNAFEYAKKLGCSYVQMFNENVGDSDYIKKELIRNGLQLIIHAPYIINIASPFNPHSWRTKYFLLEIENSINNGAIGFVVHMGKSLELPKQKAYQNMFLTLRYICSKIPQNFLVYLETTAGQGTELCYRMDDLGFFYNDIKKHKSMSNIKICLDTCHIFCAGNDIRTKKDIDIFIKNFDLLIGIDNIGLIHLNDSLNDIGTKLDRHTSIGQGFIGTTGLKYFYKFFANKCIPVILETPPDNIVDDIKIISS